MISYPCTGCGCCCKRIDIAVKNVNISDREHPLYFPYNWDEDGTCENLTEDNKCKIYHKRPMLCDIDRICKYLKLNKKEFYKLNISACNKMMDEDGIPLQFRIELT